MIKNILKEELRRTLSGRASELLIQRLTNTIDESDAAAPALSQTVKRIRVAVKLFVDEELGDALYTELCRKARLQ